MGKGRRRNEGDGFQEEEGKAAVTVADFVTTEKVSAFCRTYNPAANLFSADEVMYERDLREYFQAYPRSVGDPYSVYISLLTAQGFNLVTTPAGEPGLMVTLKLID